MVSKTSLMTCVLLAALAIAVQPASAMYTNPIVSAPSLQARTDSSSTKTSPPVQSHVPGRAGFEWSRLGIGLAIGLVLVTGSILVLRNDLRGRPARS
jgi:hypothetical protein